LSFQAYHQYFVWFKGNGESINLAAEDSGAAPLLRNALSAGYYGNYKSSLRFAQKSFATDARFGEAMLIAVNLEWMFGNVPNARSDWELARNIVWLSRTPACRRRAFVRAKRHSFF
jgi:hypothetical protein